MRKLYAILFLFVCLLARAGDVVSYYGDFQNGRAVGRPTYVFYLEAPTNYAGVDVTRDRKVFTNDANGYFVVTNYAPGRYRYEHQGLFNVTTNFYEFPESEGTIYATNSIYGRGPTNTYPALTYTTAASDARFVLKNSGTATNLSVYGSLSFTNLSSTATNIISSIGGGGASNPNALTNNDTRAVVFGSSVSATAFSGNGSQVTNLSSAVVRAAFPSALTNNQSSPVTLNSNVFTHGNASVLYSNNVDSVDVGARQLYDAEGNLAIDYSTPGTAIVANSIEIGDRFRVGGTTTLGDSSSQWTHFNGAAYATNDAAHWPVAGMGTNGNLFAQKTLYVGTNITFPGTPVGVPVPVFDANTVMQVDVASGRALSVTSDGSVNIGTNTTDAIPATLITQNGEGYTAGGNIAWDAAGNLDFQGALIGIGSGLSGLNASALATGTLPAARLPALTGAVTTSAGSAATSLGSFTSANLSTALTDETGSGSAVFAGSPALTGNPTVQGVAILSNNYSGVLTISNAVKLDAAHSLSISNASASALAGYDAAHQLTNISIGSGLTLSSGQLSASGGSATDPNAWHIGWNNVTQDTTNGLDGKQFYLGSTLALYFGIIMYEQGAGALVANWRVGAVNVPGVTFVTGQSNSFASSVEQDNMILGRNNSIAATVTECGIFAGRYNALTFGAAGAIDSVIVGGVSNSTAGTGNFLGGWRAKGNSNGSFTWADSTDADFTSSADRTFNVRVTGGGQFDLGTGTFTNKGSFLITNYSLTVGTNAASFSTNAFTVATATDKQAFRVGTDGKAWQNGAMTFAGAVTNLGATYFGSAQQASIDASGNIATSGTISGNGSGVTGIWVKEVLSGIDSLVTPSAINRYGPISGVVSANQNSPNFAMLLPSSGYISNFIVFSTNQMSAGQSVVFTIVTNGVTATPTASLISATLVGDTSVPYTNDSTHSILLGATPFLAQVKMLAGGSYNPTTFGWTLEWWHQSP